MKYNGGENDHCNNTPNKETEQILNQVESGEQIDAVSFEDILSELSNVRRQKT
jgi:hypothetical protein